jgi:hypothetical protein
MAVEWHLIGTDEWYAKVIGPASAPTNPINQRHPPGVLGAASSFRAIWTQDGQDIWAGGDRWGIDPNLANTLWRSQDGGVNWTNECALVSPGGDGNGEIFDFWGFPEENALWAIGDHIGGVNHIWYWTGTLWSSAAPFGYDYSGGGKRANSIWGRFPTDMYACAKTATNEELLHNDGTGWVAEPGSALEAQLAADGGGSPVAITGDATHLYVWVQTPWAGGFSVYRGVFGGPWAIEARSWDATGQKLQELGKTIMSDELGAIWVFMQGGGGGAGHSVHRRDPDTGIWALAHAYIPGVPAGVSRGMFVRDSNNIYVNSAGQVSWLEDGIWYDMPNWASNGFNGVCCQPYQEPSGGDLAGGPRFRVGFDPERRSGPRQEDGSLQSDLQISTGVQNIAQFDGGTMED